MFQSLLTRVEPTPQGTEALKVMADFASRHHARLIGIAGRRPLTEDPSFFTDGSLLQRMVEQQEAEVIEAGERFRQITHALGERATFHIRLEEPETGLADEAAGADAILISLPENGAQRSINLVSGTIMTSGLPVLAVPAATRRIETSSILIAWRNSPEARRAITASMPLLQKAKEVSILHVEAGDRSADAWEALNAVKARLAEQGVTADAECDTGQKDAAEALLSMAEARECDLIVLGAYGHSRASEWLLGGVTRDLLRQSTIPLLLAR